MPIPGARAAAQMPWKVSGVEPAPGVKRCQVLSSIWASSESPDADHPNAVTALESKSWRGDPGSLTIHSPLCAANGVVGEEVTQPCRGPTGAGVKEVTESVWWCCASASLC